MLRKLMVGSFFMAAMFALGGAFLFTASPAAAQVLDEGAAEIAPEDGAAEGERGRRGQRSQRNAVKLTRAEKAQVVADALGITVEELQAEKEAGTSMEDLAAANGTTVDAIKQALMDAQVTKINEAVANGDITQEQADALIERIELKALAREIFSREDKQAAVADALGMTVEEVEAEKEAGTLRDTIEASGVDVQAAVQDAWMAAIDSAEANGTITAEQADQLREMPMKGKCKGRGGRGNGGQAPATPTQDA